MNADEPSEQIRDAWQQVQACEQSSSDQPSLRLAEALENYAEKLRVEGHALEAANAIARAKNVRKEFYQNELVHDTTGDWHVQHALEEGKNAWEDARERIKKSHKRAVSKLRKEDEIIASFVSNQMHELVKPRPRKTHANAIVACALVLVGLAGLVTATMPRMTVPVATPLVILAIIVTCLSFMARRRN